MGRELELTGIMPLGDLIQVRFRWKGELLRPTLRMGPTAANLQHAARILTVTLREARLT
jgi:integrase